ncbi:MAG: carboxymuconolactone decarboxylase family protein [Gaiellales bacterium]
MDEFRVTLRRLAISDDRLVASLSAGGPDNADASGLDPRAHALVQIGALIALDAGPQSYATAVDAARQAGASSEEIVGVLVAAIPVVGAPRVVSAAPKLGLALGYDLDAALELGSTLAG